MGQSCSVLHVPGQGRALPACSCCAAMLDQSATCLESAGFLCTSCPYLMVPLTGVKREDRCKAVAAPATVSTHHAPPRPCSGSPLVLSGLGKAAGQCFAPVHGWCRQGTSQETCHHSSVRLFLREWLRSGVVCWRGAWQARMHPVVRFLCHMRGRGLVVTAPCLPQPHVVEQWPVGKTHDRRTLFVYPFCAFSTGWATRAACLRYVQAGRACHGLPAGCATA